MVTKETTSGKSDDVQDETNAETTSKLDNTSGQLGDDDEVETNHQPQVENINPQDVSMTTRQQIKISGEEDERLSEETGHSREERISSDGTLPPVMSPHSVASQESVSTFEERAL